MSKIVQPRLGVSYARLEVHGAGGRKGCRIGESAVATGNENGGSRIRTYRPQGMIHVASQCLNDRLPQRKSSTLAEFSLPDRQNPVTAIEVPDIEGQSLSDPDAGGVQQAKQRRRRRWPQALYRR
jgi:hypothetical protein